MAGSFVDASEVVAAQKNSIGLWYKPWFYKHVQSKLTSDKNLSPTVEYLPLRDYYHRHTKAIFWELEQIIPVGNHPVFRFLLGWAVPPKVSFLKLTQTAKIKELYETQHVIQDMLVPISKLGEALDVFKKEYDLYPLWICPYKAYDYSDKEGPHQCFLRKPSVVKEPRLEGEKHKSEMYVRERSEWRLASEHQPDASREFPREPLIYSLEPFPPPLYSRSQVRRHWRVRHPASRARQEAVRRRQGREEGGGVRGEGQGVPDAVRGQVRVTSATHSHTQLRTPHSSACMLNLLALARPPPPCSHTVCSPLFTQCATAT